MNERPRTGFELTEKKSAVTLHAWGKDLNQLFATAAEGLFAVIIDPQTVNPADARVVELNASTQEALLVEWLTILNDLHQIKHEVYSRFTVTVKGSGLEAQVRGEHLDHIRHQVIREVTGITWKGTKLEKGENGFDADLKLDI